MHTGAGGHVFIAEKIEGKTYYYDTQNHRFGCEDYFKMIGGNKPTRFVQINNAEFSKAGRASFRKVKP